MSDSNPDNFFSDTMIISESNSDCQESLRSCLFRGQMVKIRVNNPNRDKDE